MLFKTKIITEFGAFVIYPATVKLALKALWDLLKPLVSKPGCKAGLEMDPEVRGMSPGTHSVSSSSSPGTLAAFSV